MSDQLEHYLQTWQLSNPQQLAETVTSRVYTVTHEHTTLVLKLLKPYGVEERLGAMALRYFEGRGAVKLLREHEDAQLMEYASGEDLAGMVQHGHDTQATEIIGNLIQTLHENQTKPPPEGMRTLKSWFRSLFARAEQDRKQGEDTIFVRAASVAEIVLAQPHEARVLHGDIHHENIRQSPRGWLLFDPKGVYGERTYDLANTLCNPHPRFGVVAADEARLLRNGEILARTCGIALPRVMLFLHLYACLSAAWTLEGADGWEVGEILTIAGIAERHMQKDF